MRFSRDDMVARILYASYLAKMKRDNEARAHLKIAAAASEDNPFTQYNIGLVFLEMKDYENALLQAHRAQDMGFPRTQLRQELIAAGRWRDPSPPSKADAVPAGGASR